MAGKASKEKTLSPRLRKFCRVLAQGESQKEAALAVGVSERSADSQASQWLKIPKVREEYERLSANAAELAGVKASEVLAELKRIAFVDLAEAYDAKGRFKSIHDVPEDIRRAISGMEVAEEWGPDGGAQLGEIKKVKLNDKTKALELLGKHFKLFTDKVEHSGSLTLEQLVAESMAGGDE